MDPVLETQGLSGRLAANTTARTPRRRPETEAKGTALPIGVEVVGLGLVGRSSVYQVYHPRFFKKEPLGVEL